MATARPAARRPRKPGRPAQSAADLRERLLDAALARFVAEGIQAASLKSIAKAAGVTPALVHYYFGSKDLLLAAVVEERLLGAVVELRAALSVGDDQPAALVRGFVAAVHATVARHPWLPVLWVREILTEGGALRELMLARIAPMIPQLLATRFQQAQKAGALNPALDPRLLVVSLIGLTLFPLAAESIWRRLFQADDVSSAQLQAHTLALLERGLEIDHAH
jgi:AcrR family transcriptional regulator